MAMRALRPGDRISEYVLETQIGSGGFGSVWRAHHHIWKDKVVAIKFPSDPSAVRRLRDEGIHTHSLGGPNVVETIGLDPEADPPYLIMEYVPGEDLAELLKREGRLEPEKAVHIMLQIVSVLEQAHARGIIHRDIKPGNILITPKGVAKLADFGLGTRIDGPEGMLALSGQLSMEAGGEIVGTIAYMAPEQKDPAKKVDERTDIYVLGVVFFQMLTGELPQGAEKPSDFVEGLDRRYDRIFERCFYAQPDKRYQSAKELAAALKAALEPAEPDFIAEPLPVEAAPRREPFLRNIRMRYPEGKAAEFGVRFVAAVIDIFILAIVLPLAAPFLKINTPLLILLYYVIGHGLWGKTVGKAALGISVVGFGLEKPGLVRAFFRFFGYFLSLVFFGLGFVLIALTPRARGFHDYFAGTSVVYDFSIEQARREEEEEL
ncbi:MAG: hypothetical protein E3J72_21095 [Planctomycetota bacterium]|nr:MAG: hypothetical protein E3J72_21095 [Planctomycetota bacterium]